MFPFLRLAKEIALHARRPMALHDTHVSHHICWPWDLDVWMELNNGRALTLYDLGRFPAIVRTGLGRALHRNRWGLTMAGSVVRYRRRVRMFDRFEMWTRIACWDTRFFYVEQSMWRTDGQCASHVVYRAAATGADGIVAPERVMRAMNHQEPSPVMPAWIATWVAAEDQRPWPPMQE